MSLSEEVKKFYQDNNFKCIFYFNFLLVIAVFLLVFYILLSHNSSIETTAFIKELIEDLDKSPIFNLSTKYIYYSLYESCDTIKFGKWKGTNVGCLCEKNKKGKCSKEDEINLCKNRFLYNNKIKKYEDICQCGELIKGECSEENINSNCKTVDSHPEKEYDTYKKTNFYARRKDKYSYLNLLYSNKIIRSYEKCPNGTKPCGKIDSFNNILCLDKDDECPINNIKIDDKKTLEGYHTIKLGNSNYYCHFNNKEPSKEIISDLFLFNGRPCYDSQEINWENFNILEKGKNGTNCKGINNNKFDFRYKYLDSITQFQLYEDHYYTKSFVKYYIDKKSQEKMNKTKIDLYYRNFIGYNLNIKKNIIDLRSLLFNLYELVENERYFYSKYINSSKKTYEISEQIFKVISALIFIITFFVGTNFSNTCDLSIKILIPEILLLIVLSYNIVFWEEIPVCSKFKIIDIIFYYCDEYIQEQLKKLKKYRFDFSYFFNYKFYLILLGLSLVLLIIFLIISFFIFYIKDKYFNNIDKEKQPLMQNEKSIKELEEFNNNI